MVVVEISLPGLRLGNGSSNNISIAAVGELTHLERLNLSNNALHAELPPQLFGLRSLARLDLSRNRFSGAIPGSEEAWANLSSLAVLRLHYNSLSGPIPGSRSHVGVKPCLDSFPMLVPMLGSVRTVLCVELVCIAHAIRV
jgi:Leucine-rich repeat (LRR) protein